MRPPAEGARNCLGAARRRLLAQLRIERIAQRISQQREGGQEHGHEQRRCRKLPPLADDQFGLFGLKDRSLTPDIIGDDAKLRISGKVVLDLAAKTGSADVVIDATSVNTGHALLNEKIQDKDFFDSARYPSITFKSGSMTLDGEQPSLVGDLTIKGVTRPVTLAITQFKCESDPVFRMDTCGAQASVTIKRSDFNMGKLALLVSNDITLNLAIRAVREAPLLRLASRDPVR